MGFIHTDQAGSAAVHGALRLTAGARIMLAVAACVLLLAACRPHLREPLAEKGRLDLSVWDFEKDGTVALNGEWEFYWDRLLGPDDFKAADLRPPGDYLELPGPWNEYPRDPGFPDVGHATLRLLVITGDNRDLLALRVGEINSAWRIWINGNPFPSNPGVGWSPKTEKGQAEMSIIPLLPAAAVTELILQVSNYHSRVGGVITPLMLGRDSDIRTSETIQLLILAFVVGGLIVMGAYHLVIYIVRRSDPAPLLLAAYCILWAANTLASNASGWMLGFFLPDMPLRGFFIIDIVSYALSIPVFVMFLTTVLGTGSWIWFVRLSQSVAAAFSLFVLVASMRTASYVVPFFHLFSLCALLWALALLGVAAWRRRHGAAMMLGGFVFIAAAGINDILHDTGVIRTFYSAHLGIFAFTLSQSIALAQNYSRAFTEAQTLSVELREALAEKARYELNPHFLFNALASIRGAVSVDVSIARKMLTKLSAYCRMVLSPGNRRSISLGEELEKIRLYLDIEKIRFGDYLTVTVNASPELLDLPILPMALQPLVENAVKYGRHTAPDDLAVSVDARREGSRLLLTVTNSGEWVGGMEHKPVSTGTGIRNLRERLYSRYGKDFRLETLGGDGFVRVELDVPAEMI